MTNTTEYAATLTARYASGRQAGQLAFRSTHDYFSEAQEAAEETLRLTGHTFDLRVTDTFGSEDGYSHGFYSCPCGQMEL